MSQKPRESRSPSGGAKPDVDTLTQKQRTGGEDPPATDRRGVPNDLPNRKTT
jgi:hypothetical protein